MQFLNHDEIYMWTPSKWALKKKEKNRSVCLKVIRGRTKRLNEKIEKLEKILHEVMALYARKRIISYWEVIYYHSIIFKLQIVVVQFDFVAKIQYSCFCLNMINYLKFWSYSFNKMFNFVIKVNLFRNGMK